MGFGDIEFFWRNLTHPYHTSDNVMRLVTQPESILIIGGGYIGAEMAQVIYIHPALTEVVG